MDTNCASHPPDTQVWRDPAGAKFCCCWWDGDVRVVHRPGIGSFRWAPARGPVEMVPEGAVHALDEVYERDVLPLFMQSADLEVLHAAAALVRGRVVAFTGDSHTGKSTLGWALALRGEGLWADDAMAFRGAAAEAIPFRPNLREPSRSHFAGKPRIVPPNHPPAPLAAIFVLRPRRPLALRRMTAAEAFPELLRQAYCFTLNDEPRRQRMIEAYLALLRDVPVFELRHPRTLDSLEETLAETQRVVR